MKPTILITGAGTGIGKVTAELFANKGWQVIATMRNVIKYQTTFNNESIYFINLDVTNPESIKEALQKAKAKFGKIDVIVNNAGYGLFGAFEVFKTEEIMQQYNVNVFGLMNVCREIIPMMREQESGTIINIASVGGKFAVPYWGMYNSTKFAVEGFSEGLAYELEPFNIKVRVIEPGVIKTDFYGRSMKTGTREKFMKVYKDILERMWQQYDNDGASGAEPIIVAKRIYQAATSKSSRLRYAAGRDAHLYIALTKILPHIIGMKLTKIMTLNKKA